MAKRARPGRTLIAYFVGLGILFGLVAVGGTWKPELGLDLQGGTRITLEAENDPTAANLEQARRIIDQRVNGSGVSEAEVIREGNRLITVEIPGRTRRDLINTVKRQAQLRFRLVAVGSPAPGVGGATQPEDPTQQPSGTGVTAPPEPSPSPTSEPKNRPAPAFAAQPTDAASPSEAASEPASPNPSEPAPGSPTGTPAPKGQDRTQEALAWMNQPGAEESAAFAEYACPPAKLPKDYREKYGKFLRDDPNQPLITCDDQGQKFLLSKSIIEGTSLTDSYAGIPQGQTGFAVNLELDKVGAKALGEVSTRLVGDQSKLFAITLDGKVISSAYFSAAITDGKAQISGNYNQESATALATSLKYGSLPIAFKKPSVETIGPSLAGDQLTAGLTAGAFGLGLVLIYCLFYYRGLGTVVVASLLAAAATTYALVLLLSETAGFTLTLPGIAGLIIAVGVTADSFIIFFERIRDEMREGKSMRVAVETGWKRAKVTRLAAQVVTLLSAAVLYIFATGAVKGFGFALGLSTIVDLAILFWFTKPMVSWLARFTFFNSGHPLSGLSEGTLGMDAAPAGGKA